MKKRLAAQLTFLFCLIAIPSPASAEFRIGFILSLSGAWAEYGEAQKSALEMARSEQPGRFKNIRFIYEDCGYQGSHTVSAFQKLKTEDAVDLIFVWGVEPALIAAPLAESSRLPLLASAQSAPAAIGRKYVIRTLNYSAQYSAKLLEYLRSQEIKRLGLVQAELSFHNLLVEGLKANLREGETLDIIDTVLPADTDFVPALLKVQSRKPEIVGVYLTPQQILRFYRQAAELRIAFRSFGATAFQSSALVSQANGLIDGAVYVHNVVTPSFRAAYTGRYGNDHQIPWAANAYDMANLAAELFNGLPSRLSADEIIEKLRVNGERHGAGGAFVFRDTPDTGKYYEYELGVFQIDGKEHRRVF